MKSWRTTAVGCLTAGLYAVLTAIQAGQIETRDLVIAGGIAILGFLSKDLNVTGSGKEPHMDNE